MGHIGQDVTYDESVWIHPTALIHGLVQLDSQVSVWPNVVIRSEIHRVHIGQRSNIQDFVMVHVGYHTPTIVGEDCSITHHATLHGCEIGDDSLIGMNAVVLNNAVIGKNCLIGANALVTEGMQVPDGSLVLGSPAKIIKPLGDAALEMMKAGAQSYINKIDVYNKTLVPIQ